MRIDDGVKPNKDVRSLLVAYETLTDEVEGH